VHLASGDFNGDGVPDVLVVDRGSPYTDTTVPGGLSILLGRKDGKLGAASPVTGADYPGPVVLGDFNGDGSLDVAAVDSTQVGRVTVTLGRGDGSLAAPIVTAADGGPQIVRPVDLDGDGRLDLVTMGQTSFAIQLGRGDGTFGTPTAYLADRIFGRHALAIG